MQVELRLKVQIEWSVERECSLSKHYTTIQTVAVEGRLYVLGRGRKDWRSTGWSSSCVRKTPAVKVPVVGKKGGSHRLIEAFSRPMKRRTHYLLRNGMCTPPVLLHDSSFYRRWSTLRDWSRHARQTGLPTKLFDRNFLSFDINLRLSAIT